MGDMPIEVASSRFTGGLARSREAVRSALPHRSEELSINWAVSSDLAEVERHAVDGKSYHRAVATTYQGPASTSHSRSPIGWIVCLGSGSLIRGKAGLGFEPPGEVVRIQEVRKLENITYSVAWSLMD